MKSICFPSSLCFIGNYTFVDSGLEEIEFGASSELEIISEFSFYNCKSLQSIQLPSSICALFQYSFAYSGLISISLPSSLEILDIYCFRGCFNLTTFIIPSETQLTDISYGVFYECENLALIENHSPNFVVESEALYDKARTKFFVLPPKSTSKFLAFPDSLRTINPYALYGCSSLEIILIPSNSVIEINQYAFKNCHNLRQINIPQSVEIIGQGAFEGCHKLQCGLNIENRRYEFLQSLVDSSKLPEKCLSSCIEKCTVSQLPFHLSTKYFVIILFS